MLNVEKIGVFGQKVQKCGVPALSYPDTYKRLLEILVWHRT